MKLRLFTAGILLPGMIFAGSAEDTDLSGYTGAETETSLESIVANGGFERGADGWILKKDCRIEKNGGAMELRLCAMNGATRKSISLSAHR